MTTEQTTPGAYVSPSGRVLVPGTIIGHTSRGPIRVIAGGSGEDTGTAAGPGGGDGTGGTGDGDNATNTDGTGGSAGDSARNDAGTGGTAGDAGTTSSSTSSSSADGTGTGTDAAQSSEDVKALPEWAQKRIRDLAKEAGDNRVKAKNADTVAEQKVKASADKLQQFIDGFAKVMGLTADEQDAAPKNLDEAMKRLEATQQQLTTTADNHRELQVRLAVWEKAATLGANTGELMDSASFLATIAKFDPHADGFGTQLAEAITAQIEANPTRFKASPPKVAPAQSGGEFTGGPGGRPNDADLSPAQHFAKINKI